MIDERDSAMPGSKQMPRLESFSGKNYLVRAQSNDLWPELAALQSTPARIAGIPNQPKTALRGKRLERTVLCCAFTYVTAAMVR
jgi:hypothetical protein